MKQYAEKEFELELRSAAKKYVNEIMETYPASEEVLGKYEFSACFEERIFAIEKSFTSELNQ